VSKRVHRKAEARQDLIEHFIYIGNHNLEAARRFLRAVLDDSRKLAEMPGLGAMRDFDDPELGDVRSWPVSGFRNYLIFYKPSEDGIDLLRVIQWSARH
jgi:toxin ParE1/3/4